jgi:hypothetical protein
MSTIKNPVGPESPQTYWRRRLMVLLGLLAVIIVIVLIVTRPGAGNAASDTGDDGKKNAASSAQKTPTTPAPVEPVEGAVCTPSVVAVEPVTDAAEYSEGEEPLLSLTITNTGTAACTFGVGTDVQEYSITSGNDPIWSSKDCQVDPVALEQLLEPGAAVSTTPFSWDRTRSDPATCDAAESEPVTAGGATYQLNVEVNGVESEKPKKFLLN